MNEDNEQVKRQSDQQMQDLKRGQARDQELALFYEQRRREIREQIRRRLQARREAYRRKMALNKMMAKSRKQKGHAA